MQGAVGDVQILGSECAVSGDFVGRGDSDDAIATKCPDAFAKPAPRDQVPLATVAHVADRFDIPGGFGVAAIAVPDSQNPAAGQNTFEIRSDCRLGSVIEQVDAGRESGCFAKAGLVGNGNDLAKSRGRGLAKRAR